jgi:hypothetical protein
VCVCAAAELVELGRLIVVDDAAGLPLLACARHIEGSCATKKSEENSKEAREGILYVVEAISAVRLGDVCSSVYQSKGWPKEEEELGTGRRGRGL